MSIIRTQIHEYAGYWYVQVVDDIENDVVLGYHRDKYTAVREAIETLERLARHLITELRNEAP